ncbi:MAG: hypothetical protein AMJ91_04275 [candidate division Zixibacteria bacterium SM23_73_3]|nr:MAG: hypothetical protein AMJ91_04275 [candidate division Zixibacteria bacterium SM23_73_3]
MELGKSLKSKKLILGAGAIGVILVGFFALKFMTSGGGDIVSEKPRPTSQTGKKISKPQKKEQTKSPLFEAMEKLKDPFRTEDPRAAELQDKLKLTQKEVEYLKATLEEKKLRQEIKEIERSMVEGERTGTSGHQLKASSSDENKVETKSPKRVKIMAILIADEERSALLISGNRKNWVHEGEQFDGWEIKEIKKESVVLLKEGKTYVFFYDRPDITREGES